MNIIEATSFFVRVTCFDFKNRDSNIKLKFRIIPMIHIGSLGYYENALAYLKECDEIIYEGIRFNKTKGTTSQYKRIANQLGLVTQTEALNLDTLSAKLIHADYNEVTGKVAWRKLTVFGKLSMMLINPVKLFYFSLLLTRKSFARQFLHSQREAYLAYGPSENELETATNFLMNAREQIIFELIKTKLRSEAHQEKLIGILYGAGHMETICRYLIDRLNYVPHNGKFLKVFTI